MRTQPWLQGRRVLLVEDEYLIAEQLARGFSDLGAAIVGPVGDARKAMQLAETEKPDAAVLDINLRGDRAYELADRLRELRIPFVFATGYDRSEVPSRFSDIVHCEKPVDPHRVAQALYGRTAAG